MNTRPITALALATLTFAPQVMRASVSPLDFASITTVGEAADSKETALYDSGNRAINESRWADAEAAFTQVIALHGQYAEGAIYWKAYAQNKQGHPDKALETCASLHRAHGQSQWLDECNALEIEIRGNSGHPVQPQAEHDDDLKLLALNSLMQQDPSRALPIIKQVLAGSSSDHVKERALFVLAQSDSKEAHDLILQVARGQQNPGLQVRAIRMLAVGGSKNAADLTDIYQHTSDVAVKKEILRSYLITGNSAKLLEAVRTEQNPELVRTAIHTLGPMGATSELLDLYRSNNDPKVRADIIDAMIPAGKKGADALSTIATTEQNPELRRKAIRNLGIAGGAAATPSIVSTYQSSNDVETKKAAADALFLAGDAHDLVSLARAEKDPKAKEVLVSKLSIMRNKEATDYMVELLNK